MSELCKEQQIPGGSDRKKCKGKNKSKGNGSSAYVVSHPSHKGRD